MPWIINPSFGNTQEGGGEPEPTPPIVYAASYGSISLSVPGVDLDGLDSAYASIDKVVIERAEALAGIATQGVVVNYSYASADLGREETKYDVAAASLALKEQFWEGVYASLDTVSVVLNEALASLELYGIEGFQSLVDLINSQVHAATITGGAFFKIRVKANNTILPIKSFTYSAPEEKLGAKMSAVMAYPDITLLPENASISAELGVKVSGDYVWIPFATKARLAGISQIWAQAEGSGRNMPSDEVRLSFYDILADRLSKAPGAPTTVYDPSVETISAGKGSTQLEDFSVLQPVLTPMRGLTLKQLLDYVYVKQMGFSRVVTNIPDYRISRADFSDEATWHDGVVSAVNLYEPMYFPISETLWVLNADSPIPAGLPVKELPKGAIVDMELTTPPGAFISSAVITYKEKQDTSTAGLSFREYDGDTSTQEPSTPFGMATYTRIETTPRWRDYYNPATPSVVVKHELVHTRTASYGMVDGQLQPTQTEIHIERIDGGLKRGHRTTTEALVPDPSISGMPKVMKLVKEEDQQIHYVPKPGSTTGEMEVAWKQTDLQECVLIRDRFETRPIITPLLKSLSVLDPDDDQVLDFMPTQRVVENFYPGTGDTVKVTTKTRDLINEVDTIAKSDMRVGTTTVSPAKEAAVKVRITDEDALALYGERTPLKINAGELPRKQAIAVGKQILAKKVRPRKPLTITLPFPDMTIHRGTILKPYHRTGAVGTFLVTGYRIEYKGKKVTMVLDALEVQTA